MATKFKSSVEIDGYLSLTSGNWVQVPDGTTLQRPGSPAVGMFRYNTTTAEFEGYFGATPAWGAIGGGGGTVTEAFKTIAVSGQSDIVADSGTDTLNVAAGSNISLTTDAATDTLTIESSNSLYTDTFTGNGSTTAYALGITPVDLNAVEVYLNGLYQNVSTLTLSTNTLTFATAPPSGVIIEVRSVGSLNSGGTLAPATLTGGTGINVTTNSPNNFTIANTLGGGIDWDTNIQASNFSANPGRGYIVNTTSGEVTVTLPAGIAGNIVALQDYAGTFDTNRVLISANGSEKIQGSTYNYQCTIENATVYLLYQDATKGWTADNIADNPPVITTSYLVIAGGAGGGHLGGGGGAGGYRNSYASETTGGGGSTESTLALSVATNYTVTVGAGGAGGTGAGGNATSGSDSVFSTITSTGGGGAGNSSANGNTGGSGGGGGSNTNSQTGAAAVTSPVVQGYAGGDNFTSSAYSCGGGGGAGAVGTNGLASTGGNGGAGLSSSITGSATTRAGGGGGGVQQNQTGGTGGTGGGGNGTGNSTTGSAGTINTGSGAGGGGYHSSVAGNGGLGGSGIVILRYPVAYTLTNPGGGLTSSTATDGSYEVATFTAGTGNIQFN